MSDYCQYIWGTTRMDSKNPIEGLARKALEGELNTGLDNHIQMLIRNIQPQNEQPEGTHIIFDCVWRIIPSFNEPTVIDDRIGNAHRFPPSLF